MEHEIELVIDSEAGRFSHSVGDKNHAGRLNVSMFLAGNKPQSKYECSTVRKTSEQTAGICLSFRQIKFTQLLRDVPLISWLKITANHLKKKYLEVVEESYFK